MSSVAIPKLGFGTWEMGGRDFPDSNNDDQGDINAIRSAIDAGITHIDTAEAYAGGKAEELTGKAISVYERQKLVVASKVRDVNLAYDSVLSSCEQSLRRLGTDYLDLYYVHQPNPAIPVAETARAFNRLLEQKMIRGVGLSNVSTSTIREYNKFLAQPVCAVQNHYNLIVRQSALEGVIDFCRANGIVFIAWRPIQLPVPALGIASLAQKGAYPLLDEIAGKYGKSNAQIAVRWLTSQNGVGTIFKSRNSRHIEEIVQTGTFEISGEDMRRLTKDFPLQKADAFTSKGYIKLS